MHKNKCIKYNANSKYHNNWAITKDKFIPKDAVNRLYCIFRAELGVRPGPGRLTTPIRDYYLIKLLLESGLRVSEAVALRVRDILPGALIVRQGKGGKPRTVLLSDSTSEGLQEYLKLRISSSPVTTMEDSHLFVSSRLSPLTTRAVRKRVKFWFKKAGISAHLSCHSCRHTYISHMIAAGVDLPTVQNNAGHSSLAVTSLYAHVVRDGLGNINLYGRVPLSVEVGTSN